MPNRGQAIIWTNADPTHRRIYAALGGDELTPWGRGKIATISQTTFSNILKENVSILLNISMGFVPKVPIENILTRQQAIIWTNDG